MILSKILDAPLPVILPALFQSIPQEILPEVIKNAPDIMIGFIAAILLIVYVANMYGKMPGKPKNGGGLTAVERETLAQIGRDTKKVTDLLAWRDDDGMERFLATAKHARESSELLVEILEVQKSQDRHLETIASHLAGTA
jgi:hypothetical protein